MKRFYFAAAIRAQVRFKAVFATSRPVMGTTRMLKHASGGCFKITSVPNNQLDYARCASST